MSCATAAEAEGLEAHRLERAVAGQDHQVGPGDLVAVLLLDGPQQPARLVEVAVVGPAVDRREALIAGAAAAAPVRDAVGARAVPGHADEQAAVVAPVGRPPVLRIRHQRVEVLLQRGEVELLEFLGVVELLAHRVGLRRVLVQDLEVQPVGPPVAVRLGAGMVRAPCIAANGHFASLDMACSFRVRLSCRSNVVASRLAIQYVLLIADIGMLTRYTSPPRRVTR